MKNMQGQQQGQQDQQHHIIAEEKIEDATMCARRTEKKDIARILDPQFANSNLMLE